MPGGRIELPQPCGHPDFNRDACPVQVVGEEGLEPSQPCGQQILSLSRIPVPPLAHHLYGVQYTSLPRRSAAGGFFGVPPPGHNNNCNNVLCEVWSGRRDSHPRPLPWQGSILLLNYSRRLPIEHYDTITLQH